MNYIGIQIMKQVTSHIHNFFCLSGCVGGIPHIYHRFDISYQEKIMNSRRHTKLVAEAFGFELKRISGSHHIYEHPGVPEIVNLQNVNGKAKPYQVKQLLQIIERYDIQMEE